MTDLRLSVQVLWQRLRLAADDVLAGRLADSIGALPLYLQDIPGDGAKDKVAKERARRRSIHHCIKRNLKTTWVWEHLLLGRTARNMSRREPTLHPSSVKYPWRQTHLDTGSKLGRHHRPGVTFTEVHRELGWQRSLSSWRPCYLQGCTADGLQDASWLLLKASDVQLLVLSGECVAK